MTRLWLALLAGVVVSTGFGADPLQSVWGHPERLLGVMGIALGFGAFLVGCSAGPGALPKVHTAVVAAAGVVSVIALGQFLLGDLGRPTGSLGNAGFLGAYLCLALPIAVSRALAADRYRLVFTGMVAVGVLALAATTTRGAWIGAAAGVGAVALLRWRALWAVLPIAAAIAVALIAPVRDRDTARGRLDTWSESIAVVKERPALGWGPEGFRTGFASVVSTDWVRTYTLEQTPDRSHNRFIDIAATTGTVGVLADLGLIVCVALALRRALRTHERGSETWWAIAGTAGAVIGYIAQGLFLFDTFDLSVVAWTLVGLTVGVGGAAGARNLPSRTVVKLAVAAALLSVVACLNVVADRLVQSASGRPDAQAVQILDRAAALRPRALDTYLLAGAVALASDDPAVSHEAHALLRTWADPHVRLRDADVLAHQARLTRDRALAQRAAVAYRLGLRDAPTNGPGWLGLGTTLLRLGDRDDALRALRRADRLMPARFEPPLNLATLAFARGDNAEGCRQLGVASRRRGAPSRRDLGRVAPVDCGIFPL
ncbi:MAG TPA: O-antigen ligase family protein [Acidimicrobiales bacterium]|nr:O-antigen ligase family protein [Acidimicrobiales bacterium]